MSNWKSLSDQMLHSHHRCILQPWRNSSTSHYSTTTHRSSCLVLGGIRKASTMSPMAGCSYCRPPPPATPSRRRSPPLLMVPPDVDLVHGNNSEEKNEEEENEYFHFFNVSEHQQIKIKKNLSVSWHRQILLPDDAPCVGSGSGSSHNWLAFINPHNSYPYLYNPFMVNSPNLPYIPLPSLETLPVVLGFRTLKSDHSSPSPSLITHFVISDQPLFTRSDKPREANLCCESAADVLAEKIAISSDPTNDDCTIMGIFGPLGELAFCKPGDDRWTALDCGSLRLRPISIVYFSKHQKFYVLGGFETNTLQAWDLRDPSNPKNQVFDRPQCCKEQEQKFKESYHTGGIYYLVESSGDLLMVSRYMALTVHEYGFEHDRRSEPKETTNYLYVDRERENELIWDDDAYWTLGFEVHRFDFDHSKWEVVECLGDRALFVGSNQCFSVSTRDYPEIMENSIYFADNNDILWNNKYSGHDNGIFCLGEKIIKPCYPSRLNFIDPHPVWVAPSPI